MHPGFPLHDMATAPADSVPVLEEVRRAFGMIPNLERSMATAPALLAAYGRLCELFGSTSFSPAERQIVYQTINVEHGCDYWIPWHTKLARDAGVSAEDILALREGNELADPKQEALHAFTRRVVRERGRVSEAATAAFLGAGWGAQQVLEVVLGVSIKIMSNYTNAIVRIPLDAAVVEKA